MFLVLFTTTLCFGQEEDSTDIDLPIKAKKIGRSLAVDIGFNRLLDAPDLLELNTWRSKAVNFFYYYNIRLIGKKLTLNPGIGLGLENYSFDNNVRFNGPPATMITPFIDTASFRDYRKSKLALTYVDIPLEIRFQTSDKNGKAFKISAGAKAGYLIKAQSKVKYETDDIEVKEKAAHSFFLNNFRYGLVGRIGYGYVNAFAYYSLSELFEKDKWPEGYAEATPFIIGISFTTF